MSQPRWAAAQAPPPWALNASRSAVIFLTGLGGSTLPLCLGTGQSSALELGVAFSGGVFIAAGFCHLLPDATEALSDAMGIDYPVAPLLCSLGMLAMLIIDQLTTRAIAKRGTAPAPVRLSDEDEAEPADHAPGAEVVPLLSSGLIPSIILFSALSFHSLMAGLSLGVSDQTAWAIFISILAHKAFAAFALGASFVRHLAVSRRTIACWMLAFSVTTPTGVMLGTALTTVRASNGSRYATAQPPPTSLAGGGQCAHRGANRRRRRHLSARRPDRGGAARARQGGARVWQHADAPAGLLVDGAAGAVGMTACRSVFLSDSLFCRRGDFFFFPASASNRRRLALGPSDKRFEDWRLPQAAR